MAVPVVTKLEITEFTYDVPDITPHEKTRIPVYQKGKMHSAVGRVLQIFTDIGITVFVVSNKLL